MGWHDKASEQHNGCCASRKRPVIYYTDEKRKHIHVSTPTQLQADSNGDHLIISNAVDF
jgi:hypothetical protein